MTNVLIVDDEKIIRDSISNLIDWEKYDCVLIGKASNGKDAIELIEDTTIPNPDIIITDIKMPIINGLDLIKKVSKIYDNIVFIVLSGYDEFEFAKKAMEYGVKHYLLKPTSEKEIIKLLLEAQKNISKKKRIQELINLNQIKRNHHTENYGLIVNEMITIIDENITNSILSLKWIAKKMIFMNEDYLSKLFIKETGEKFTHYVMIKKIELAKELMINNRNLNLLEIACMTGFEYNPKYFSQVFKKYTGLSPSDYRKKVY